MNYLWIIILLSSLCTCTKLCYLFQKRSLAKKICASARNPLLDFLALSSSWISFSDPKGPFRCLLLLPDFISIIDQETLRTFLLLVSTKYLRDLNKIYILFCVVNCAKLQLFAPCYLSSKKSNRFAIHRLFTLSSVMKTKIQSCNLNSKNFNTWKFE